MLTNRYLGLLLGLKSMNSVTVLLVGFLKVASPSVPFAARLLCCPLRVRSEVPLRGMTQALVFLAKMKDVTEVKTSVITTV